MMAQNEAEQEMFGQVLDIDELYGELDQLVAEKEMKDINIPDAPNTNIEGVKVKKEI